jgi:hypothetical protein
LALPHLIVGGKLGSSQYSKMEDCAVYFYRQGLNFLLLWHWQHIKMVVMGFMLKTMQC